MFREALFLGVLSKPMREYIKSIIEMCSGDYDTFYDFNCGSFAIAECAAKAGMKHINCSDIGLYASVIGYFLCGVEVRKLACKHIDGHMLGSPEDILFQYWIDKLNPDKYYENYILENISAFAPDYKAQISNYLAGIFSSFENVDLTYQIADMWAVHKEAKPGIYFFDPPGSKKNDYVSKLSWIGDNFEQTCIKSVESDYLKLLQESPHPIIIRRFREVPESEKKFIVYAERKKGRYDYILSNVKMKTKYENLDRITDIKSGSYKLFQDHDKITTESKPFLKLISRDIALYYRDLFNRGMGSTQAERYFGFFIDGKLVGVSGFFLDHWLRKGDNCVIEQFGFSVRTENYPRINKLHMMVLTSGETANLIKSNTETVNEKPGFFKTICLTKHHEQKGNRGIMKIKERTVLPNGLFHIIYETPFYKENWHERMIQFLRKEKYDITTGEKLRD